MTLQQLNLKQAQWRDAGGDIGKLPQLVFSFKGAGGHEWWYVGTGRPIAAPCNSGCSVCNPIWK